MSDNLVFCESQLFWPEELNQDFYVEVRVQQKGDDDFKEEHVQVNQMLQLRELSTFARMYPEDNIWRSWSVFYDIEKHCELGPVPLCFDIDEQSQHPNLEHAYRLTEVCLGILEAQSEWAGSSERLRVVFSGRKGFHIEVKPPAPLNAQTMRKELLQACEMTGLKRVSLNVFIENTVLDPLSHQWIRLTGALHSWSSEDGQIHARRTFQMSPKEFRELGIGSILQIAEMA
jgi:hypothetical protein